MNDREQDLSSFVMAPGDFGQLVTIPVTIISQADGDALEAAVGSGLVTGTVGGFTRNDLLFSTRVDDFDPPGGVADPNPDNNSESTTIRLRAIGEIFVDGFESGAADMWTQPAKAHVDRPKTLMHRLRSAFTRVRTSR